MLVLGGGPGGYVAALHGAQLGLKVCLVEKEFLGGVCLNKGCIPSKTLLAATELFTKMEKSGDWGIELPGPIRWNHRRLFEKKDEVVKKMRQGLDVLCQKRKVFQVRGEGVLTGPTEVKVNGQTYQAKRIVIATGSAPKRMDFGIQDKTKVFSSEEALSLQKIPETLLILGGGAEGCEFALIFRGLGSKVTLVETRERLLPTFDRDAGVALRRALVSKGVEVLTEETAVTAAEHEGKIRAELKNKGAVTVDAILACVGRSPNSREIGLQALGIACGEKGAIGVDRHLRTNLSSVYAIGDVTGNLMMAHAASYEGYMTSALISGKKETLDYTAVPACVYTYPEVAEVGLNEDKAVQKNVPYEIGRFAFMALGRSHAKGQTEGFVKVIGHAKTGEVLGGVIVGEGAPELINLFALAIKNKLKVKDLREHIAPHPSAAEAVVEAAHLFFKEGLHFA